MHAAIDEAVDKLYRQLNKQKERIKAHRGVRLAEALPQESEPVTESSDHDSPSELVLERLEMKPQFEDEAIEELEARGQPFYVFLNARTEQVNVVYRRKDGALALIEPRLH